MNIDKLATKLHAKFCGYSHEDQCSWYRDNKWAEEVKERWRKKARELMEEMWS